MITSVVDCVVDPAKIADFGRFAARWMEIVEGPAGPSSRQTS